MKAHVADLVRAEELTAAEEKRIRARKEGGELRTRRARAGSRVHRYPSPRPPLHGALPSGQGLTLTAGPTRSTACFSSEQDPAASTSFTMRFGSVGQEEEVRVASRNTLIGVRYVSRSSGLGM